MLPLVSVIITTYNRLEQFHRALNSVLTQTYTNIEIIVIDDCSSPPVTLPSSLHSDLPVKIYRNPTNCHLSFSRNLGVSVSTGSYIAFLDDDDFWHPDKLSVQVQYMIKNKSLASYTDTVFFDSQGVIPNRYTERAHGNIFDLTLLGQPTGNMSTYLIKRQLFELTTGFDRYIRKGVDGLFIRQIAFLAPIGFIPVPLTYYSVDTTGGKITVNSDLARRRSLKSLRLTLLRYQSHLDLRPYHRSVIYLRISMLYLSLGKYILSSKYLISFLRYYFASSLLPARVLYYGIFTSYA
jgi:glycosyltransferase involved in cell wall biosynthesis